jgi:UDP-glucose 4-epimerase
MRLLVTGGAGYIGSVVVRHLVAAGHDLVVVDRASRPANLPGSVAFAQADIGDVEALDRLLPGQQGVLHFAASIDVGESMQSPIRHFRNNTANSFTLLEAMQRHGVDRLVFSSTAAIYGEPETHPVKEEHPRRPGNPYGESKLMVETALEWLHRQRGFRYASLRYFNAAGGDAKKAAVNLIPIVLEVAAGVRPYLEVFGTDYPTPDGTAVRDYVHVEDLASAHVLALHAFERRPRMVLNLGSGTGFSVLEVVETARRVTGHPIPVRFGPRRPGDAPAVVASSQLAQQELGWVPTYTDLESIVRSAWESKTGARHI